MQPPAPPSGSSPLSADDFLKAILRSGLLDQAMLKEALRSVPRDDRGDARAVAEHFIKAGHLSRFQADKLLKGAAVGLVLGPYQVLAPLGKGGMGTVYLARDGRGGQLVALKVLAPKKARNEERMKARFLREMEMSQRVSHPHLAWTYEAGQIQGVYYIAMEYIPGKSLYRVVAEGGPLPVPRAARLMAEVAAALEHAHNQGLIHRDLKPSNILVTPHDHAKVLDLGLALIEGEQGADKRVIGGQGYIVGTMDYIAPEQSTDATKADRRSDVYSLGCTLYFALTGRPPFPGGTSKEKIQKHRTEEPEPILSLRPDLPLGFANLVHRMMAKDPDERFPSAVAAEEELERWANGEPVAPLDRPEDDSYVEAVTTLQRTEPSQEYSYPDLPAVPVVRVVELDEIGDDEPGSGSRPSLPAIAVEPPRPPGYRLTKAIIFGLVLTLFGLAAAGLLILWQRL
jgi:eukaryotic-like serine/threonine-protein kinase